MAFMCENIGVVYGFVLPLVAGVSAFTALLIALSYLLGQTLSNPKINLWAKTEIVQLIISAMAAVLILSGVQLFCTFNFASVGALFGLDTGIAGGFNIFDAANSYLFTAGQYIKDVFSVARYHVAAYNILQMRTLWKCEEGQVINILFCIFGSVASASSTTAGSGGASAGISIAPESGYGFAMAGMNVAFNAVLFSYLSILNYMFILRYILSAMVFFFFPVGIFLRSMPYLRGLGTLFMSVTLAFLFVYPTVLAVFYLDLVGFHILNPRPSDTFRNYIDAEGRLEDVGADDLFDTSLHDDLFPINPATGQGGSVETEVFQKSGNAFLLGVFVPTIALLATIGSIMYLNRFLGQEIDLSRIVQMV